MVIVICQHTGIPFEAARSYEKNHPRLREFLQTALTVNMYGSVVERLKQAREAGLTDLDTIVGFARTGDPHDLKEGSARRLLTSLKQDRRHRYPYFVSRQKGVYMRAVRSW